MKSTYFLIILLCTINQFSFAQDGEEILGSWTNEDSSQVVRIEKKGDLFFGKLVSLSLEQDLPLLDEANKNDEKKNRKLLGIEVWLNFEYDKERELWKDGQIYNFKNGNIYNGKIQVEGNELKLTGHYGLFFFLAKTQNWTRVLN